MIRLRRAFSFLRRIRHRAGTATQQPRDIPLALSRESGGVDAGRRCQPGQHQSQGEDDEEEDDDLALDGTLGAVLGPLAAAFGNIALDRVAAELEPDHAGERDAVAEELQAGDGCAPDCNRGEDEDDVFEDAAEGEDEGGGFANLMEKHGISDELDSGGKCKGLTKVTNETLRPNAIIALSSSVKYPTWLTCDKVIFGISNTAATRKFMIAQTGAK